MKTEPTFTISTNAKTMKHIEDLMSLNDILSNALRIFGKINDSIKSESNTEGYPYDEMCKKIFELDGNLNSSILSISEAIGMLCTYHIAEQAMNPENK